MNSRLLLCGAVSAILGWWAVSLFDSASGASGSPGPVSRSLNSSIPGETTLHALQNSEGSSSAFTHVSKLIADLSADSLTSEQTSIAAWPPSALRAFALALLEARKPPAPDKKADDGSADTGGRPSNPARDLAELIARDQELVNGTSSIRENYGDSTLRDWTKNDPAAATGATLTLPPGSPQRTCAVNIVAETMARSDPHAAMEFVIKSGEPHLSFGAAEAFGYAMIKNPSLSVMRQYFERMPFAQQNSLLEGLALVVPDYQYNVGYSIFDDSNRNPNDPQHRSDMGLIACAALETTQSGPGLESFARNLLHFPMAVDEVSQYLTTLPSLTPAQQAALDIFKSQRINIAVTAGNFDPLLHSSPAIFDHAAPAIIENLATPGGLPRALTLLHRIQDDTARIDALQTLLPVWIKADPAAARAAFDAAPLTALERERWERDPGFLGHAAQDR